MYVFEREQFIPRPLEEVFEFFNKPENLARITPRSLQFEILTPQPIAMREGAVIDYTIRLGLLPMHWTTLITEYNPPHRFVDQQLKGPYTYWNHTHTFEAEDGGTLMRDAVRYKMPLGMIGSVVHSLRVKHQLQAIFDYRMRSVEVWFRPEEN